MGLALKIGEKAGFRAEVLRCEHNETRGGGGGCARGDLYSEIHNF